ncbi:hypothetical protein [Cytobacillus solani]|uniref:hypothetical protein n=1 Tax=Cytobacillus solani TaxID=1637975 RepID=UPI0012E0F703|nr:hypothetical protein [Cytobacillus solani]
MKIIEKGVVVMKEMFTSLNGLQILVQIILLAVNIAIFSNSITEVPVKENDLK